MPDAIVESSQYFTDRIALKHFWSWGEIKPRCSLGGKHGFVLKVFLIANSIIMLLMITTDVDK